MEFELSEELKMLRDMVREFASEKIAPSADEWDENSHRVSGCPVLSRRACVSN